jgi:FkbM family methyltransferase
MNINNALSQIVRVAGHGFYETLLYIIYRDWIVKPGHSVIDIGAHQGLHTFRLAELVGGKGKVFAFEPLPELYEQIRHKSEQTYGASQSRVVLSAEALSDRSGQTVFFRNPSRPSQSTLIPGHGARHGVLSAFAVSTTTLDCFYRALGARHISFMKIDAEGSEFNILSGGKNMLKSTAPLIAMEFLASQLKLLGRSCDDFNALCDELSYSFYYVDGTPFVASDDAGASSPCYEILGARKGHWIESFLQNKLAQLVEKFLLHYSTQKGIALLD